MSSIPALSRALVAAALLAALALFVALGAAQADHHDEAASAGQPMLVKIHADWCGTCTRLNPTWEALQKRHGKEVDFVIFDVTDDATRAECERVAKERGLEALLETHGSRTGTIAVLGAGGGEPVAVIKGETDVDAYDAPLAKARES